MKDTLLELIAAAKHVVACWPTNQLADAVNNLERLALAAEAELESAAVRPGGSATPTTAGETPAAPSPRVVIIVAGGVVTDVLCSDATTRVELLDHDNAETKAERDTLCLREAEAEAALHHVPIH